MNSSVFLFLAHTSTSNTPPSRTDELIEWLTNNPLIGWGFAGFAVLAMAAASIAKLTGNLDSVIGFIDKYRPKKREITDKDCQKLRQQLIEVVLRQVVKRLEDSLHHKIRMDLRRKEEHQRVGRRDLLPAEDAGPPDQLIRREINPFSTPSPPTLVEEEISTADLLVRDDIQGKLLILGEPGAGKTNELLALTKELLQQAQKSADAPIPVIFELSEWSGNREEVFAEWLSEQLKERYNVPLEVSKHWLKHKQLFPLLDGLDELRRVDDVENTTLEEVDLRRQAKQIQCMRVINEFLDVHSAISLVVCCRRKEYEALEAQGEYLKSLSGAIHLQELDDQQIENYLNRSNRLALWHALKRQPTLLKLTRSPLFMLMVVVAYQGQPSQSTDELLDLYIEKQLEDLNNQGAYPLGKAPSAEKTHHYLAWLATKLERQEVTEFLIERLQPSWLERKRDRRVYSLSLGLSGGLIFGLSLGLSGGLIFGLSGGLIFGLFFGLSGGLIFGLIFGLSDIESTENLSFSWRRGLSFGLSFGLSSGLIAGLSLGLLVGLSLGLLSGLSFSESEIYDKQSPNQGIRRSIKKSLSFGLLGWLGGGLLGGLSSGEAAREFSGGLLVATISPLNSALGVGLIFGLSVGLIFGLSGIRHATLRLILYQSGIAPWNYEKFLEHAENHRFIQRVGGRYRFVHDLLRKRFAERYQSRYR